MATMMIGTTVNSSARLPVRQARSRLVVSAVARPAKSAKAVQGSLRHSAPFWAAVVALSSTAQSANAAGEPVDSAVDTVIEIIKAAGSLVKSGVSAVETGYGIVKEGYDVVAPVVLKGVDAASPVVSQVVKTASDVAAPAIQAALPALQSTTADVQKAIISSSPVSVSEVTKIAAETSKTATPLLTNAVNFITTTEPVLLGEYALGAAALYLLAPTLFGLLIGSFRGFAGEISAVATLDAINNESGTVLVDIRTGKEKEASGVPDVPSAAASKVIEVEYAVTEDRKLRGQLRDPAGIEAQVTALQIASLKKAGSGSKVILLDRYGSQAKIVAKELSRKGFGKVYVVAGGFDGSNGWVKSKLQIKPFSLPTSGLFGTVSTASRKSLPAPRSA